MNTYNQSEHNMPRDSKLPTNFQKVRDWLIEFINENDLSNGAKIPPERVIAEKLGLSRPTVSKAIIKLVEDGMLVREQRNGTYLRRGLSAVEKRSGWHGCTVAVMMPWLRIGSTGCITGCVDDTIEFRSQIRRESFIRLVAEGVLSVLQQHGSESLIYPNNSINQECEILLELLGKQIDGLIAIPVGSRANEHLYERLADSGTEIVLVDRYFAGLDVDRVASDNFAGARDAVRHLISKGHRRIGLFADFYPSSSLNDRVAGYKAALDEAGIPFDPTIVRGQEIMQDGSHSYDLPLTYCVKMVKPITAAFCCNDDVLLSVLRCAQMLGLSSPGDLELAGFFDDHIDEAIPIPFTRVNQRKLEMGRTAAEMLVERMSGKSPAQAKHVELPTDILPCGQSRITKKSDPVLTLE